MKHRNISDIKVVDRPEATSFYTKIPPEVFDALLTTLKTGKAIRVPLNGEDPKRVRERYAQRLWRRGLGIRSKRFGEYMLLWVVKLPELGALAIAGCAALCGLLLGASVASASPVPLRTTEVGHVGTFFGCPTFLDRTAERFAIADGTTGYFDSSASSGCTFLPTTINFNTFPVSITGFQVDPASTVYEYTLFVTSGTVNTVTTQFPDLVVDTGIVAENFVQICCPGVPLGTWDPQTQTFDVGWFGGLGGRSFLSYYVLVSPDAPTLGRCLVSGSTSQSVPCLNPDPVDTAVPEPPSAMLLGVGLVLGWMRRTKGGNA